MTIISRNPYLDLARKCSLHAAFVKVCREDQIDVFQVTWDRTAEDARIALDHMMPARTERPGYLAETVDHRRRQAPGQAGAAFDDLVQVVWNGCLY